MDKKMRGLITGILVSLLIGSCAPAINMVAVARLLGITNDVISITNGIAKLATKQGIRNLNLPEFLKDHNIDVSNESLAKRRIRQLDAEMQESIVECSYRARGKDRFTKRIECLEAKGIWNRNDIIYMVCKHGI